MDMLPGYVIAAIMLRAEPSFAVLAFLTVISIDLYSSVVGTFIDLSLPTNLSTMIKSFVQILFIYFGLIPIAGLVAFGMVTGRTVMFLGFSILFCLIISGILFLFIPQFIKNGKK